MVKIYYILILMQCILDLVVFYLFLVACCLLQAYQLFLSACQKVTWNNLASKNSFRSLEGWSKYFLVEQILFICSVWLYGVLFLNYFGCSKLMLRKVWWSVFFLNVLIYNLLFLIHVLVSRNEIISFNTS